ncbi:MAG: trypsin-like serine protease [Kofleriaceae bacterium]
MPRVLAVALLLASSVASAENSGPGTFVPAREPDPTVVGGNQVPPGKWPDTVAVLGEGSCSGTLIAPDVVLTAGHCADIHPTRVIANSTNYVDGGTSATVKTVTEYPSWDTSYDVAVIVLNSPITGVTPRKLGTACTFAGFTEGAQVRLVGFGLTDPAGRGDNTLLNEAMAPVIDPDCMGPGGCEKTIRPGGEFIAGGSGTDSCFGDSGGPVYLDTPNGTVVIGAVSRGLDGSTMPCGGGGIYVRTDKLIDWIEEVAGKPVAKDLCDGQPYEPPVGESDDGGCSTGGGSSLGGGLALLGLVLGRRRR